MKHRLRCIVAGFALAAPLFLSACSDQLTEAPQGPISPAPGRANVVDPIESCLASSIESQIKALATSKSLQNSLLSMFRSIPSKVDKRTGTAARDKMFALVDAILDAYYAGQFGGTSTAIQDKVLALISSLYCFVRLDSPTLPAGSLGEDGVVGVVTPNSPTTTLATPSEHAAVTIPAGAAPTPTTIVIRKLPDEPGPLFTSLDQYPFFYEFSSFPEVTFNFDVLAGICPKENLDAIDANLRLAHNVGPDFGDVEVLPRPEGAIPGLDCTDLDNVSFLKSKIFEPLARVLLPEPLHAAGFALATSGVGGTTKKYSPFGIVDITSNPGSFSAVSPTTSTEAGGSTVTRTVRVESSNGEPIANVPVTFSTESGNGTVSPAQPVLTDGDGEASASWTLPMASGTYELTATVPDDDNEPTGTSDPPAGNVLSTPDVAFSPQSITFTAVVGEFFSDGFEDELAWTTTGFWHQSTLKTGGEPINNAAVPFFVNDVGDGGDLPAPALGDFALWYGDPVGDPLAGNYLGLQAEGDGAGSGGTSDQANSGDAVSPAFSIPASAPAAVLRFDSWFEIEGVDSDAFDLMAILVDENGNDAGGQTVLGYLNPAFDPDGSASTPFTTAGLGAIPVWQEEVFDLSSFKGKTVQLIFRFDTGDFQYNGFRGWIIDNVRVDTDPILPTLRMAQPAQGKVQAPRRRTR